MAVNAQMKSGDFCPIRLTLKITKVNGNVARVGAALAHGSCDIGFGGNEPENADDELARLGHAMEHFGGGKGHVVAEELAHFASGLFSGLDVLARFSRRPRLKGGGGWDEIAFVVEHEVLDFDFGAGFDQPAGEFGSHKLGQLQVQNRQSPSGPFLGRLYAVAEVLGSGGGVLRLFEGVGQKGRQVFELCFDQIDEWEEGVDNRVHKAVGNGIWGSGEPRSEAKGSAKERP